MSQPQYPAGPQVQDLIGQQPGMADLGSISNQTVQFDEWVGSLLNTPGADGIPDQVSAPMQCANYLSGARDVVIKGSYTRPLIRVTDANMQVMGELHGELSCSIEELIDDTGKCQISILYDNWLTDWMLNKTMVFADLNLIIDPYPTKPDWRSRWGGKIVEIHVKHDDQGIYRLDLVALHFREHAKHLLVAANPVFPPEVQLPRMWIMAGPIRTICATTSLINLARIFAPGWSFVTNVFNPAGWINPTGPDAILNVLPTEWPIQVAFINAATDQSRWSTVGGTWTDWHSTYKDVLRDGSIVMKAYTFLTTDEDSPNYELVDMLAAVPELLGGITNAQVLQSDIDQWVRPQRNCVIFAFENKSGITGPTGTAADGLLNAVAVTLDDLITPVTIDLKTGNTYDPGQVLDGEPMINVTGITQTYLIQQLLGVAPGPPTVVWWDGTYSGMIDSDATWHKGAVKTTMTGSKSPQIVNEAQTFAIRYSLAQLSDVINNAFADAASAPIQTPGSPGLDNLYQGQLDNVLFAWQRFTDPIKALYAGDLAWQEHFEKGSGTAYTLASVLTLRSGDWKTRAWNSFTAHTHNGFPWVADYDYYVGDRVGFEQQGIVWVDNVYSMKRTWDWENYMEVELKIGDDQLAPDPFGLAFKTMANIYAFVGALAGEGTLFSS